MIRNSQINHYHEKVELEVLNKTQLKVLYLERMTCLSNLLPYLALSLSAGVSYVDIDIPDSVVNQKLFKRQKDLTDEYLKEGLVFQEGIISYSDKKEIIEIILLYEQIFKIIHLLKEER